MVRNSARRDEGFSLLEMMAVVLILGILVAIAVASYRLSIDRAGIVTCQANQRILNTAVSVYEQQHEALPPDLAALAPYLAGRKNYDTCPADSTVHYQYDTVTGKVTCPLHPPQ